MEQAGDDDGGAGLGGWSRLGMMVEEKAACRWRCYGLGVCWRSGRI